MTEMTDDEHEAYGAMRDPKMHAPRTDTGWMSADDQIDFDPLDSIDAKARKIYEREFTQPSWEYTGAPMRNLFRMRAAVLAEREACAEIAMRHISKIAINEENWHAGQDWASQRIADAIRARAS